MKASELIKLLQEMINDAGDKEVKSTDIWGVPTQIADCLGYDSEDEVILI